MRSAGNDTYHYNLFHGLLVLPVLAMLIVPMLLG